MIWLEADRMGFFLDAVTQKKFEVQRSTVKNERGQNYDNRPYGLVNEFSSKNMYPYGHPYSWLTIGYVEDLNRVNVEDLKNFFLRWYGPNNATITIGGDITPAETLKWVEKYFGSIGNFFNIEPIRGVYSFNPPYQYDVISNGVMKIINNMEKTKEKLAFIITIPIWDNEGKKIMLDNNMENNNNIIKYDDFEIMNVIRNSVFYKGLRMISKDDFTYMDHNFYLFKNKTIQNTYVIVMSNYENDYINTINQYSFT
jgi:Zn-dependent M16 (insulinase) family peptidase